MQVPAARHTSGVGLVIINLIRHGQSLANADEVSIREVVDHRIDLSPLGREQAHRAGKLNRRKRKRLA